MHAMGKATVVLDFGVSNVEILMQKKSFLDGRAQGESHTMIPENRKGKKQRDSSMSSACRSYY